MVRARSPRASRMLLLAVALLGLSAGVALAQGTQEQREACTPDALKLCQDTIPDVAKTEACMRRHEAELSPRCHAAFLAPSAATRRAARADAEREAAPGPRQQRHARRDAPDTDEPVTGEPDSAPRRLGPPEPDARDAGGPPGPEAGGPPGPYARDADAGPPDGYDEPWPGPRGYGPPGPYGGRFADGGPPDGYGGPGPRGYGPPDRDGGRYHYGAPDADAPEARGGRRARLAIRRLCAQDLIDPRTCALVRRALAEGR